jgi:chorismate mutase
MVCATYIDKALFNVIPLIFATLIDQRADSENHLSHIVITRAQRVTVVRTLNQTFGKKMDQQKTKLHRVRRLGAQNIPYDQRLQMCGRGLVSLTQQVNGFSLETSQKAP